jgi:hypothetical protein
MTRALQGRVPLYLLSSTQAGLLQADRSPSRQVFMQADLQADRSPGGQVSSADDEQLDVVALTSQKASIKAYRATKLKQPVV